jgi:hypothetical protein
MAAVVLVLAALLLSTPQSAIMTSNDVSPLRPPVNGNMNPNVSRQVSHYIPDNALVGMPSAKLELATIICVCLCIMYST